MTLVNQLLIDAVALWPEWADTAPNVIKKLNRGLSNHSYLIEVSGQHYVLRLDADDYPPLTVDRYYEGVVQELAAAAEISAPLIYQNFDQGLRIVEYIQGAPWSIDHLSDDGNIIKLADIVANVHALGSIEKSLNIPSLIQSYLDRLSQSIYLESLKNLHADIVKLISELPMARTVLCHSDLLASNVIETKVGKLKIIDWEYATMADPCFELAVIIEGQCFPEENIDLLVSAYISCAKKYGKRVGSNVELMQRLSIYRIIYSYIDTLWYLLKVEQGVDGCSTEHIAHQIEKLKQRL